MSPQKIREISLYGLLVFVIAVLAIQAVLVLAAVVSVWLSDGVLVMKGIMVILSAVIMSGTVSIGLAFCFSLISVSQRVVSEAGFGEKIFNNLVSNLVDDFDDGDLVSNSELNRSLNAGLKEFFKLEGDESGLFGPLSWLMTLVQRVILWATFRMVIKECSEDGKSVSLSLVRSKLGGFFDRLLIDYLNELKWDLVWKTLGVSLFVVIVGSFLLMK